MFHLAFLSQEEATGAIGDTSSLGCPCDCGAGIEVEQAVV